MVTAKEKRPPVRTRCPKCDKTWGGLLTAHCSQCCETFSSVKAFDYHRAGSHAYSTRHCVPPEQVKYGARSKNAGEPMFVDAGRGYQCWSINEQDTRWD